MCSKTWFCILLTLLHFTPVVRAQSFQDPIPSQEFRFRSWTPADSRLLLYGAPPATRAPAVGSLFGYDKRAEDLALLFAKEPPRILRAELEGQPEAEQRFHGLPGGIVLGLQARPPGAIEGARIVADDARRLFLCLPGGARLACPPIDPATLAACIEFVTAGADSDTLVDLLFGQPRLAPAFAGTPLDPLLVRMDRVPHRVYPLSSKWKSLIVDRDAAFEIQGEALLLRAELEVRFYDAESGWAQRLFTLDASRGSAPQMKEPDLAAELAPLADLAAWIAFLRWAAANDARGLASSRERLLPPVCQGIPAGE